jgi:hypothetical protein
MPINKYTLFWQTGNTEIIHGKNINHALNKSGYDKNSVGSLDFFKEGNVTHLYKFNKVHHRWNLK